MSPITIITTPSGDHRWIAKDAAEVAHFSLPGQGHKIEVYTRAALTQGAGSTIEWQVRGRHHYEWRRTSEEIARAMYLVNPGHVRAVTVVEGAVPKGGL